MDPRKNRQKKRNSSALYLKIIVLGDAGIGKTCLINRYIGGCYKDTFSSTLGVDFKVKDLECSQLKLNLQIWDTAGQQRYKTITKSYFQGCHGVLLMFSLTDIQSFNNIQKWLTQLQQHADPKLVKILVGTKVDSPDQRIVQVNQCSQLAIKYDLQYFEVSSKTGYNVNNIFETLAQKILSKNKNIFSNFYCSKTVKLINSSQGYPNLKKCQC